MSRHIRNTAPKISISNALHINDQTGSDTLLASVGIIDRDTLPEYTDNVLTVSDTRFEIVDGGLYLKEGVHLAAGVYQLTLTASDAHDPSISHTKILNFRVDHGPVDPTLQFTGSIDPAGTQPDGSMWFGAGNPSTGYTIVENGGLEFGWKVHYRTGDNIESHTGDDGLLHFAGPAGHQTGYEHNVQGDNLNRSAVSLDYALVTGLNGSTLDVNDYIVKVFIDRDPTAAVDYKSFTMVHVPGDAGADYLLADDNIGGMGNDDGANPHLLENSLNFGFGFLTNSLTSNTGDFQAGTYDIRAEVWDITGSVLLIGNHIVLDLQ